METIKKQSINVITTADENLMPLISVQIMSIVDNLPSEYKINYFLLYDTVKNRDTKLKRIEILQKFSYNFKNLTFQDIDVGDIDFFSEITSYGGGWPTPAYYQLLAHRFLPENIDRILYLDAGDVFVAGDFREFYFADFCDNVISVTPARYKVINNELVAYEKEDVFNLDLTEGITRGLFNSGSYMMNTNLMREINFNEEEYMICAENLKKVKPYIKQKEHEFAYHGDQGFMSAYFLGKIKFYGYPEIKNIWYMPFNFCLWYYDRMNIIPWYKPVIIHFAGAAKPWEIKYPYETDLNSLLKTSQSISDLKQGSKEHYLLWHEYALKTNMLLLASI